MPPMRITPYIEAVRDDLLAVASVGQREGEELIGRLASALESSLRLRLLEAVTEAAQELSVHINSGHVEVRLAGSDPTLAFVEEVAEPAAPVGDDLSARITLRLPESLKSRLDAAASVRLRAGRGRAHPCHPQGARVAEDQDRGFRSARGHRPRRVDPAGALAQ